MIGRRGFLAAMIGAAVLDPERLLWVPGKKVISIPKVLRVLRKPINAFVYYVTTTGPCTDAARYDWITKTYANSGWDVLSIKSVERFGTLHSTYVSERVEITLAQQYDPRMNAYTGGHLYGPPRHTINGKPVG